MLLAPDSPVERGRQRKRSRKTNSGTESSEDGSSELTAATHNTSSKSSTHHGKTAQEKMPQVKVKTEKTSHDSVSQDKLPQEKRAQDKVPQDRTLQDKTSHDKLSSDQVSQDCKPHDKMLQDKTRNGADEFLRRLFQFMKERNTPIQRVPHLGFKQRRNIAKLFCKNVLTQQLTEKLVTFQSVFIRFVSGLEGDVAQKIPPDMLELLVLFSFVEGRIQTKMRWLLLPFELHLRGEDRPPCWRLEGEAPSDCQVLDLSVRREAPAPAQCLDLRVHRRGDENCALQGGPLYSVYRLEDAW
ncbi:hypothetical protein HPB48_015167 [Haemaphysalis longicornis]|uniref:Uncharacterized protein n=1 Tax=Haemaphysalis longicornis TaxID=44386 RepID=A0A9J6F9H3_HAELO|nr:hypothetical protein HPB48_015167 [Haemaphysalis longicornis]